ncbi:hypothetical protein EST38_g8713 [Candolleomyces aberdarensis]|uniref:Uncharacterized protein n=1 Tax=Candolleomyces aberdarensis TaxID=2316362 RepID=A0A4Q2DDL2_9AGAR|nr:hypothetical protein EST38_g8713 [Candolleomyces aberdarensis]
MVHPERQEEEEQLRKVAEEKAAAEEKAETRRREEKEKAAAATRPPLFGSSGRAASGGGPSRNIAAATGPPERSPAAATGRGFWSLLFSTTHPSAIDYRLGRIEDSTCWKDPSDEVAFGNEYEFFEFSIDECSFYEASPTEEETTGVYV